VTLYTLFGAAAGLTGCMLGRKSRDTPLGAELTYT